jgi:hypothetical protein
LGNLQKEREPSSNTNRTDANLLDGLIKASNQPCFRGSPTALLDDARSRYCVRIWLRSGLLRALSLGFARRSRSAIVVPLLYLTLYAAARFILDFSRSTSARPRLDPFSEAQCVCIIVFGFDFPSCSQPLSTVSKPVCEPSGNRTDWFNVMWNSIRITLAGTIREHPWFNIFSHLQKTPEMDSEIRS